ncbi:Ubp3 associated protein Bre5 [Corynebacterium hadale]|nr:hypothetical protein [Corynebacterium hadale]WKC61002.1 Ubp3 associated protein Bre5 [Corynebacterium hadale]
MKKHNVARRRGTSIAAAALSLALVAPFAQPVAAPTTVQMAQAAEITDADGNYIPAASGRINDNGEEDGLLYAGLVPEFTDAQQNNPQYVFKVPHLRKAIWNTGKTPKGDTDANGQYIRFRDEALYSQIARIELVGTEGDAQGSFTKRDPKGSEWGLKFENTRNFPGASGAPYASYIQIFLKNGKKIEDLGLPAEGSQVDYYWVRKDGRIFNNSVQHVNIVGKNQLAQVDGVPSNTFEGTGKNVYQDGISKQLKYDQEKGSIKSTTTATMAIRNFGGNSYWNWILNEYISPDVAKHITDVTVYKSDMEGNPVKGAKKWKMDFDKETGFATTATRPELSYVPHGTDIDPKTKDQVWVNMDSIVGIPANATGSFTIEYQLEEGAENLANSPYGKRIDTTSWISVDFTDKWPKALPNDEKQDGGAKPTLLRSTLKSDFLNIADSDGDGLTNDYERELGTDSSAVDTDGDGIRDDVEVLTDDTDPVDAKSFKPAAPKPASDQVLPSIESLSGTIKREQDKDTQGKDIPLLDVTNADAAPVKIVAVPTGKLGEDEDGNLNYEDADAIAVASLDDAAAIEKGEFKSGKLKLEDGTEYTLVAESPNGERTKGGAFKATDAPTETPAPSITDGSATDEVVADGSEKALDDKVKDPTDGMTGDVLDKDGNPIKDATVTVDPDTGEIKVSVPEGTASQDGTVVVKDKDGKPVGDPIDVKITKPKDETPAPSITDGSATDEVVADGSEKALDDKVKDPTDGMTGDVLDKDGNPIKDATVTVDPDTGEIKVSVPEGTASQDGTVVVKDKDGKPVGDPIDVKITKPKDETPTTSVEGVENPSEVKPTDEEQSTGVKVNNPEGTTVTATDEDEKDVPVEIDDNGNVVVTPGTDVDGPIKVTIEDEDLPNGQVEVEVPVEGHEKGADDNNSDVPSDKPVEEKTTVEGVENPSEVKPNGEEQSTGVKVNNPEGTTVTATDEDGNKVDARIDADGNVVVTPGTDVDGPIKVTIADEDLPNGQVEVEVPVAGHAKGVDDDGSDKPVEAELPNWKADKDTGSLFPGGSVTVPNAGGEVPAGTTVEVEGPGKAELDGKGNLVITANDDAKPGEKITVTIKDENGTVIGTVSSIVDKKTDEAPAPAPTTSVEGVENPSEVKPNGEEQSTGVKVNNPEGTTVTATDEDEKDVPVAIDDNGNVVVTPGADVDGPIKVTIADEDLPNGQVEVEVPVEGHEKGADDNNSDVPSDKPVEEKTTVEGVENPSEVKPNGEEQSTGVKVNNPEGTTVTATDEDEKDVPVEIDDNGNVVVTPGADVDGPIKVTIADEDLPNGQVEVEVPVEGHSKGEDDNESDETPAPAPTTSVEGVENPSEVKPTDEEQSTGVKVNNPEGTTVTATDEDEKDVPVEIDDNGNVVVTPGTDVDGPIKVTIEDEDLPNGQVEVEVPVEGHEKGADDNNSDVPSDKPVEEKTTVEGVENPSEVKPNGEEQSTGVKVNNPEGTTVTATDEDGNKVDARIDADGNVVVTPGTDVDGPIKVTIADEDLPNGQVEVEVPVAGHAKGVDDDGSDKPVEAELPNWKADKDTGSLFPGGSVTVPNAGGEVPAGTTVEVEGPGKAELDGKGNLVITANDDAKPGEKITVTIKDENGTVIGTVSSIVDKKTDEAPAPAPTTSVEGVENPSEVKPTDEEQSTGVKVNNPEGTTVTATDEDEKDVPVEIDDNGNVVVTPGADVDGPIKVTIADEDLPNGQVEVEVPVEGHEKGADDNNSDVPSDKPVEEKTTVEGVENPSEVKPNGEEQSTGVKVNNPEGTTVTATDEDEKDVPVAIDDNGNVVVTPGADVDGPIKVTIADEDLPNGQVEVEVPVEGHSKGEDDNESDETPAPAPTTSVEGVENPSEVKPTDEEQSTGVKVNNPEGTTVTATDEDEKDVPVEIDDNGNVVVTPGTDVDGPIKVTIEDEDLPNGQVEVEVPVEGHGEGCRRQQFGCAFG